MTASEREAREAEHVLGVACRQAGTLVDTKTILATWRRVPSAGPIPRNALSGKWHRLLSPGLVAGRLVVEKRSRTKYYGPAHAGLHLPPEEEKSPRWPRSTLERFNDARGALDDACAFRGCWVPAGEVISAWERAGGDRKRFSRGISRALQPGIRDGTVLTREVGKTVVYAPADRPDLDVPKWPTDEDKVIEAVRRASSGAHSAVPVDQVIEVLAKAPELQPWGTTGVATILGSCSNRGRLRKYHPQSLAGVQRWYYSVPRGPTWVRNDVLTEIDARRRVIVLAWRWTGGLPFTIPTLRRFCELRSIRFDPDPPWRWSNVLHHFEGLEEITRLPVDVDESHVMWVLRSGWDELLPEEQDSRRAAVESGEWLDATGWDAPAAASFDLGWVSRNRDCRALIARLKSQVAAQERDPSRARIVKARPVSIAELRDFLESLGGKFRALTNENIADAFHEAGRVRHGMIRAAVLKAGSVAGRMYYDTEIRPEGMAYLEFLDLLATDPNADRLALRKLQRAEALNAHGSIPIARSILDCRASLLTARVQSVLNRIEQVDASCLLEEEREDLARHALSWGEILAEASEFLPSDDHDGYVPSTPPRFDILRAAEEIAEVGGMDLTRPRTLPGRLHEVMVLPEPPDQDDHREGTPGRNVETSLDEVSYRLYATGRWGGAMLGSLARLAGHVLGQWRDPAPLVEVLRSNATQVQYTAAAGLAFLGDRESRRALARYVTRALRLPAEDRPPTPALEAAILGLCPMPFGSTVERLASVERKALELAQESERFGRLGDMARRVLSAWDEEWDREQVLWIERQPERRPHEVSAVDERQHDERQHDESATEVRGLDVASHGSRHGPEKGDG